jgi:hypothetical protein
MRITLSIGAVVALASAVGCSAAAPSAGPDFGSSGGAGSGSVASGGSSNGGSGTGNSGSAGGGSSSGAAASGTSSTGSVSSSTGTGSGSATSSGSTGGSSTGSSVPIGDAGSVAPTHGCGQGSSCTAASDLAPPASADGFQIAVPPNMLSIQPGQEAYFCYYKTIPGSAAINVGAFQSWMTKGFSHHFILFTGNNGADGTVSGGSISGGGGVGVGCVPQGTWVYATSTSGEVIELKMPDGVGLPMPAGDMFIFNIHLINTGSTPANPTVKLNVLYAKNATQSASAMVSFNAGIAVPAGGSQDVRGSCSPPAGSKFFAFTTHVHRHGGSVSTGAYTDVNFVSGGQTTNLVHSTDWENPDVALWTAPNFLTTKAGDQFTYDCHFVNKDATTVTFGETAATGEMCMSIGYYFPAGAATMGTSNPYCH